MKAFICITIVLITTISCQYDPFSGDMTTIKPKFSEATGVYKFENQTFGSKSINKELKESYIILNKDNSFKAVNIPNVIHDKYQGSISGNGKWHIEIIGGVGGGQKVKDEWGIYLDGLPKKVKYIDFTGKHFPYKLMITYGDPDEGAVAIFKRLRR